MRGEEQTLPWRMRKLVTWSRRGEYRWFRCARAGIGSAGSGNLAPSGSGNGAETAAGMAVGSPSSGVERSGTGRSGGVSAVVEVEYERFERVSLSIEDALFRPSEEQSRSYLRRQFQRAHPHEGN